MSCSQITACQFTLDLKDRYPSYCVPFAQDRLSRTHLNFSDHSPKVFARAAKLRQHGPICLFGDKGKSGDTNEGSPWKALEKVMGNFKKEPSLEEQLKQRLARKESFGEGGSIVGGGNSGGGGGGGGGGGSGDGSGESEDEGEGFNDAVQMILAALGFVFLYVYILDGEDITRITGDFIKFIFTRKKSIRLSRFLYGCSRFFQLFKTKPVEEEKYWLEYSIINTPTWYDGPNKYKRILISHIDSLSSVDQGDLGSRSDNDDYKGSRSDDNDDDL